MEAYLGGPEIAENRGVLRRTRTNPAGGQVDFAAISAGVSAKNLVLLHYFHSRFRSVGGATGVYLVYPNFPLFIPYNPRLVYSPF